MHFCTDELNALLALIPQAQHILLWCQVKLAMLRAKLGR